jgi:hypothetical protein
MPAKFALKNEFIHPTAHTLKANINSPVLSKDCFKYADAIIKTSVIEKRCVMTMVYELLDDEDQAYNDFMNVYQAMFFTQDFTNWDDSLFYQTEELELEVV